MKAPRVTPLEGVSTSTVAPVDVAHTYGSPPYVDIAARYAPQGIRVRGVENPQGFGIDERRFIARAYIALVRLFLPFAPCKNHEASPQSAQSQQRESGAGVRT